MLASTSNLLQMCSFDANKSTKGASKLRRDLINTEIANLRDLLPLPTSTRQRLSQLQLMALVCVYVRKANYFQNAFKHEHLPMQPVTNIGFSKALNGFLMMMTQNGKLLYISENAAEYLGHSMEDLLIHGDSVYDIIEKQDHQTIQNELMRNSQHNANNDSRIFLCRMNVSRNSRRQMRFGDQKVVLVEGHFVSYLPLCSRSEPVFLATCTPVAMPETRECVVQGSTNVFTSIHSMDMKFVDLDANGEFHLGYNKNQIKNLSWYDIVHWDNLKEAQSKHGLITQSEQERSCILLLRLQTANMSWVWVHVVLQVKDNSDSSQQPVIVCTNQVLSEKEAAVMKSNSWLYQYYSLHSKMHYTMQQSSSSSSSAANVLLSSSCVSPSIGSNSNSSSNGASSLNPASTTANKGSSSSTTTSATPSNYEGLIAAVPPPPPAASSSSTARSTPYPLSNYCSPPITTSNIKSTLLNPCLPSAFSSMMMSSTTTETPALHPTSHPITYNYNGNNANATGHVSINTSSSPSAYHPHHHAHYNHFGTSNALQQYSPQAGSLPYQIATAASLHQPILSPNTPLANQTEARVKEEITSPSTTRLNNKRSRSSSAQDEEKKNSKKKNNHNNLASSNNAENYGSGYSNGAASYHAYQSSTTVHHHYHTPYYHPTGFNSTDLSTMMPAYYGGPMAYHSQLSAYHQHPFPSKFSFFESGTTGQPVQLSSGSHNRNEEQALLSSSPSSSYNNLSFAHAGKPCMHAKGAFFASSLDANDRRELDKMKSPESITSATSDYGSMSSQSPPSTFTDKSYLLACNGSAESLDHHQASTQSKSTWPSHYHATSGGGSGELDSGLPFSRLPTFQFWPGYSTRDETQQAANASMSPVGSAFLGPAASVYGHQQASNLFGYNESINTKPPLVNRSSTRAHKVDTHSSKSLESSPPSSKLSSHSVISVSRAL